MFIEVCVSRQRTSSGVGRQRSLDEVHNCVDVSILGKSGSHHTVLELLQTAVVP